MPGFCRQLISLASRHVPASQGVALTTLRRNEGLMSATGCGRRSYVRASVFDAISELPAARAAREVFAFLPPGAGITHTTGLLHRIIDRLEKEGRVERKLPRPLFQRVARAISATSLEGLVSMGPAPDGKTLHRASRLNGPLQLLSFAGLQPGRGNDAHSRLHATVLLASFEHKGRHIGILLDGNDPQDNPVALALQRWLDRSDDARALHELSGDDLEAFNRDHHDFDVYQCAFRLVDLDAMVEAGHAQAAIRNSLEPAFTERNPLAAINPEDGNTVLGVPDIQAVGEPMTASQARSLAQAIEFSPSDLAR